MATTIQTLTTATERAALLNLPQQRSSANRSPSPTDDSDSKSTAPRDRSLPPIASTSSESRSRSRHHVRRKSTYHHVAAIHSAARPSILSHEGVAPEQAAPSFLGFRNLMILVLVVMNLRLVVENFMKYGVLICVGCHNIPSTDLHLSLLLYALIPCHLFVAYLIEFVASQSVKGVVGQELKNASPNTPSSEKTTAWNPTWFLIGSAHTLNATLCLLITSYVVYFHIHHPMLGTACEIHAIIAWLKTCSYAFTNRDLREAMLHPETASSVPEYYTLPYPRNITISNLCYFWWAPTLVYQPVYPRSPSIRWGFVAKRVAEVIVLSAFIWFASAQYAAPLLRNSLDKVASFDIVSIVERIMKLSTISLIIWLAGFFAIFQSGLNALAEIMRFGDRQFYDAWWNSPSVGTYWRTWNKPVYNFMKRHIFFPLVNRGCPKPLAGIIVFVFSGVLHELMVGIPTHNFIGVAFLGMVIQVPLITLTLPLESMKSINGKILGNCIFWISFCLVGQPFAALMYFFAWQAKYGSVSMNPGVVAVD